MYVIIRFGLITYNSHELIPYRFRWVYAREWFGLFLSPYTYYIYIYEKKIFCENRPYSHTCYRHFRRFAQPTLCRNGGIFALVETTSLFHGAIQPLDRRRFFILTFSSPFSALPLSRTPRLSLEIRLYRFHHADGAYLLLSPRPVFRRELYPVDGLQPLNPRRYATSCNSRLFA